MARTAKVVDRKKLTAAIEAVNGKGLVESALFKAAEAIYNKSDPPEEVNWQILKARTLEWGLPYTKVVGKRGRQGGPKGEGDDDEVDEAEFNGDTAVVRDESDEAGSEVGLTYETEIELCPTMRIVKVDSRNLMLQTRSGPRSEKWVFHGYFSGINCVFQTAMKLGIPAGTITAQQLLRGWQDLAACFLQAIKDGPKPRQVAAEVTEPAEEANAA